MCPEVKAMWDITMLEHIWVIAGLIVGITLLGVLIWAVVSLRRVVPTNFVHIVQSRRKTTPYGREKDAGNVYYEWPDWLPHLGVT
jgi:flotillin